MTKKRANLEGREVFSPEFYSLPEYENDDLIVAPPIDIDDPSDKSREKRELIPPEYQEGPYEAGEFDSFMVDDVNDVLSGEGSVTIKIDDEEPVTYSFEIPPIPGADDQEEFEQADLIVEDEEDDIVVEHDPWSWTLPMFPKWLQDMLGRIPRHSGRDTVGLERAIAYMEYLDREISKAVRSDLKGELPIDDLGKARTNIRDGIDRLKERHKTVTDGTSKGRKKKGEREDSLVKEGKAAQFTVVVPLFISSVARTCINSMVSAGKDIEECFHKISKEYNLTKREQAELMQLLADMNYPIRRPRMTPLDEEIDTTSTENLDWAAGYPA